MRCKYFTVVVALEQSQRSGGFPGVLLLHCAVLCADSDELSYTLLDINLILMVWQHHRTEVSVFVPGLPAVLVGIVVASDKNSYGPQEYGGGQSGAGSSEL